MEHRHSLGFEIKPFPKRRSAELHSMQLRSLAAPISLRSRRSEACCAAGRGEPVAEGVLCVLRWAEKRMGLYRVNIGIMEKNMETTI